MLLSIIVPVYNVEKYIARCIESLINQDIDGKDYEIILVNDDSTDSSISIAKEYAQQYQQIKIINQKNTGPSGARNNGLKNSRGTYIYYMDSDDYIEKNVLKSLLEPVLKNDLDFLGFTYTRTSESNFNLHITSNDILKYNNLEINEGCSFISKKNFNNYIWWYIFKKDIVIENNIEFIEGIMVEDGIYTTELLLNCKKVAYIPLSIYRYFENTNSIMRNTSKTHIARLNNDYKLVINKFTSLIDLAKENGANKQAIKRLTTRQQSYMFFLLVRLVKANTSYKEIKSLINEFRSSKVYPLKDFIGIDYNSKKEKTLTHIFNNKALLYFLITCNNKFKFIK
ncbi:glycosyltransferase [Mariniflexile litorale]|uniref:Glycosyltransferase n=1 Tax=Mariniflexile litorale TaxID=3045158 RepID=A0AAU7EEX0_9FLAO|nr:glycosyltransferase [Mariniflexile sp. KMM 9835]MDQ8211516.1 glycosyltransferase [Mariniflexile sp. KMM 9835]